MWLILTASSCIHTHTQLLHPYIHKHVGCCKLTLEGNSHRDDHPAYQQWAPPPERYPIHSQTPWVAHWAPNPVWSTHRSDVGQKPLAVCTNLQLYSVHQSPKVSSVIWSWKVWRNCCCLILKLASCLFSPPPRLQMKEREDGAKLQCFILTIYTMSIKYHCGFKWLHVIQHRITLMIL